MDGLEYGLSVRSAGTFSCPVRFGNIMAMIGSIGLLVLLLRLYRSRREQIIYIAATLLVIFGLYTSTTRGAMLAYLVTIILIMLVVFRAKGIVLSLGIIFLAALAVLIVPFMREKLFETIFQWNDPSTSFGWRFVLWRESWKVFMENPLLGVGFMNLSEYFKPLRNYGVAHAHNNFLQILGEHGIIGFIAISMLYIRLAVEQVAGVLKKNGFALMGLSLSVVLFVAGITEYCVFDSEICMLFWFMSGMLIAAQQSTMGENVQSQRQLLPEGETGRL